jgi:hypothetical protein
MKPAMTTAERIAALQSLGYDADEARFLCLAALHSGYFLRRQFLTFIQGTKGWKDVALLNKLKAKRHCQIAVFRHNRMIYHLAAKPLYDALGEKDNRNRRERQPSTIKNKLMGLDFVIENPQHQYLATEREKLDYFIGMLKMTPEDLPSRWYQSPRGRGATAKHFVDKYPLFLAVPPGGAAPVVHFCYVDEGLQTTDGFATYLNQYSRLLAALADFRVIYIAQHGGLLGSAGRVFEAFSAQESRSSGVPLDPAVREVLDHFEARRQYEMRDFSRFDTAGLIRYREERKRFNDEHYEALYERWRAGGAAAVLTVLHPGQETKVPVERFSTCVLEYDYDLFGTLTSGRENITESAAAQTQP